MMKGAFFLSYELSWLCDSHGGTFDFGTGPLQIDKRMRSVSLMKVWVRVLHSAYFIFSSSRFHNACLRF